MDKSNLRKKEDNILKNKRSNKITMPIKKENVDVSIFQQHLLKIRPFDNIVHHQKSNSLPFVSINN